MLPLYWSRITSGRMNRHGYGGGGESPTSPVAFSYGARVNTLGESGRGLSIRPDKYEK